MRVLPVAAGVGPGENFQQVTIGVFEVESAAAVVAVDLARSPLAGVGPVLNSALANAAEDLIEVVLSDEKGIVLRGDLAVGLVEVE